jgi:hypothetical protein
MNPDTNDKKLLTKRVQGSDRATVVLSYPTSEAKELRKVAQSITLKQGKRPSLSLLARRGLHLYSRLLIDPTCRDVEVHALNAMVTPVAAPAGKSKRKTMGTA